MLSLNRRGFLASAWTGAVGVSIPWTAASRIAGAAWDEASAGDPAKAGLIFRSTSPRNAEPKPGKLVQSWVTPVPEFYIRSHGAIPEVDAGGFRVSIDGLVESPREFSAAELLGSFRKSEFTCTVSCAGIRRMEFSRIRPVKGVQWAEGPIGNATWSGVRLSDVLKSLGVKPEARHVWFEGADAVKDGEAMFPFGGSVPLTKVLDDDDAFPGVLLATHMNGEPLRADHGFPLRTIVPGFIGARSVKWLRRITVSQFSSPNHFVADVYKMVAGGTQSEADEAAPIYRYPINAAACSAGFSSGPCSIRGYALPAGHRNCRITSVEVSADAGTNWTPARLDADDRDFCWRLWTATLPSATPETEICVRATDSFGNTMPATVPWNAKGYLYNAWHKVTVRELTTDH